eukprot:4100042-Alexandrium_andersonii.AAC.1
MASPIFSFDIFPPGRLYEQAGCSARYVRRAPLRQFPQDPAAIQHACPPPLGPLPIHRESPAGP